MGWVPVISGMVLLTITWMTFSSKDLFVRPAVTGNWALYLAFMVPYFLISLIASTICGISNKVYVISMRLTLAAWAAMFLILFVCCAWYGRKAVIRLSKTGDKFNRNQQLRVSVIVCIVLLGCGVLMGINAYLMEAIDKSLTWFLIITSFYRCNALFLYFAGAIYTWVGTTHWVKHPPTSTIRGRSSTASPRSQNSAKQSYSAHDTHPQNDYGTTSSSSDYEDDAEANIGSSTPHQDNSKYDNEGKGSTELEQPEPITGQSSSLSSSSSSSSSYDEASN
jgi:membrane protein implicated in regulation of membrane protease activity